MECDIDHDNNPSYLIFSRKRSDQRTGNNGARVRREVHIYEEINLSEVVPDHGDVDIVSGDHPPSVVPRTDVNSDGYLNLEDQQDSAHAHQISVSGNDDSHVTEDQQGYPKPVPSNHDVIKPKYFGAPVAWSNSKPVCHTI